MPNKNNFDAASELKLDDSNITHDPKRIADQFNEYFCSIGAKLADAIEHIANTTPENFLTKKICDSIYLDPPSNREVLNQISSFRDKAAGQDNLPAFFLKAARFVISPYLTFFLHVSFNEGIFPNSCKIARVAPIYKSGAINETKNYRPISILTCLSKIHEKLIYTRMINFFEKHDIIDQHQYRFQCKVSTTHAMLDLITSTYDNINDNAFTGLVMVDLKKAFDTVSHSTLLSTLQNYGIRGVAAELMRSYLQNCQQFVSINQHRSNIKTITCGVPQGSSLGPLVFLLYVNDLANALSRTPRLFADDTCLVIKSTRPYIFQNKTNSEVQKLHVWCCVNKLTVNPDKTNVLIVSPKPSKPISSINVSSNGTMVKIVNNATYLGVIIHNKLEFQEHIKLLESKVAR